MTDNVERNAAHHDSPSERTQHLVAPVIRAGLSRVRAAQAASISILTDAQVIDAFKSGVVFLSGGAA